jgi:hypothetical protein
MLHRRINRFAAPLLISAALGVLTCLVMTMSSPHPALVLAASRIVHPITGPVTDSPSITIGNGSATSSSTPTVTAHEAQVQWVFGTVAGTYTTCTIQAQTSYDGATWLNLGSPASVTVASNQVNAWTILEQAPTTSVTTSAVSSTAALGFGLETQFVFACSGAYGTSAPVTVSVIYR